MKLIYLCILLITVSFTIFYKKKSVEETFNELSEEFIFKDYDVSHISTYFDISKNTLNTIPLVISINVFEKPEFLLKQLHNIQKYVKIKYVVILNCNEYMLKTLPKYKLKSNIFLNPVFIEKRRFHGSLLEGILSNIRYSVSNFEFNYFLILSSRTVFHNYIYDESEFIKHSKQIRKPVRLYENEELIGQSNRKWKYTKLFEYVRKKGLFFASSQHEGLCFNYETCLKLLYFLEINPYILDNLVTFKYCVEEFGLQTICTNLNLSYYNINNDPQLNHCDKNKLTNKIDRN